MASRREKGRWRRLTVLDEGSGIPRPVQARIFESRVTSKVDEVLTDSHGIHGRGMALFSIRRAVESIELVRSGEGRGTIFKVLVDLHRLPERKDQSTWPTISLEDGAMVATGPHNVLRSLVELTFDESAPSIYLGSNAEVLATLFAHSRELARRGRDGRSTRDVPSGRTCTPSARERSWPITPPSPLGLEVSERNAFRILEEDIGPLLPLNELSLRRSGIEQPSVPGGEDGERVAPRETYRTTRRFSRSDLDDLAAEVLEAAGKMGDKYFLKPGRCRVQRSGKRLVISVYFDEE